MRVQLTEHLLTPIFSRLWKLRNSEDIDETLTIFHTIGGRWKVVYSRSCQRYFRKCKSLKARPHLNGLKHFFMKRLRNYQEHFLSNIYSVGFTKSILKSTLMKPSYALSPMDCGKFKVLPVLFAKIWDFKEESAFGLNISLWAWYSSNGPKAHFWWWL